MGRIEALLSDAQKKQWQKMLGTPLDLADWPGRRLGPWRSGWPTRLCNAS